MRVHHILVAVPALAIATLTAQQSTTPAPAPGQQPSTAGGPPSFFPPNFIGYAVAPPPVTVPAGFTPIFNGTTLSGWHVSRTNHHGRTPDFFVMHGAIIATQNPYGGGGILLTDKKYKNFELSMEVKPDWGCDSGIFLRSTESGAAYQVTMDFLPNGGMGNVIGEGGMTGVGGRGRANAPATAGAGRGAAPPAGAPQATQAGRGATPASQGPPPGFGQGNQADRPWVKVWKRDDWNAVRVRMEGEIPHVQVWFNDVQVTDFTDVANNAISGITEGPIAIQVHGGPSRWVQGGFWRWRNLGIKELP